MKQKRLSSFKSRAALLVTLLCTLSAVQAWADEGNELANCEGTGSGYGTRRTMTDSHSIGWVLASSQNGYLGANNATNHNKIKPTDADLPVVKAVKSDATTSTTGYYFYYTTTAIANVGSIEFSYTANSGNSNATAYVVVGDAQAASGGDAYEIIELATTSPTAQNASIGTSGTFTYTFKDTQTSARYYGLVIVTSSYKRMTDGKIKLKEGTKATLSSISVTNPPTTTAYKIGEAFSTAGMVVTGTYSDNSTKPVTGYTMAIGETALANGDVLNSAGNKMITISYQGKTCEQAITVAGITSLAVKTAPTKIQYKYKETLDLTGLVLTATYSDNEIKDLTEGFSAAPASGSELTASGNVTLSYYGAQCTQAYTVGTLSSLTYNSGTGEGAFANTIYTEKDHFNPTGLVVTAHYSNGISEEINNYTLTPSTEAELTTENEFVTVSYTWEGTEKTVNIPITVNSGMKYTVHFDAGNGNYTGDDITETAYQGGITLPTATTSVAGWVFAGWAEAAVTNTSTKPTFYAANSTYYPKDNTTLYAVYKLDGIDETKYKRATEVSEVTSASSIIIVNNGKVLKNDFSIVNAPTETDNKVSYSDDIIWTLTGNNTSGYTIKNGTVTVGANGLSNANLQNTLTNNKWIVEKSSYNNATDLFVLRNKNSENNGCIECYYGNSKYTWKLYTSGSSFNYLNNQSVALKIYVPVQTAYNSNPTAIIEPIVTFDKEGTTLYLDGTTTYTNEASVEGVAKTITYKSSDEDVATVDANGEVTAQGIGTATITASVEAELGVSAAASATYNVTVKSTTTIAGIKAVNSTTTATAFTADLTDADITYVSGKHAYIQDASAAIYVSCATNDWVAGNKFNGAVSGKVKKSYGVWEITEFTGTPAEGGSVPDALTDVAISDITSGTYANYEGKKITLTGVTITAAMASTATSGGEVSDGTNTIKIGAPATGITLVKDERGRVTGFVAQYSGTYRLNLYEQAQFAKTHNVPQNQTLTFEGAPVNFDEGSDELTSFTGLTVSGAHTTVTYTLIDEDEIVESFDPSTGEIELNGKCGTATVTANAAEDEIPEGNYYTPYYAASKSYTITVHPIYTSTFFINGEEFVRTQNTHGTAIAIPVPAATIGNYHFVGWKEGTAIAEPTNTAPAMVTPPTTPTSNVTYYAVYAIGTGTPLVEHTSTFTVKQASAPSTSPFVNDGSSWTWNNVTFSNDQSACMPASSTISFTLPSGGKAVSLTINSTSNSWAGTDKVNVYLTDNSNNNIKTFNVNSLSYDFTSTYDHASSYTLTAPSGNTKNAWISTIVFEYTTGGISYSGYRTSFSMPTAPVTIGKSKFSSVYYGDRALVVPEGLKAYTFKVNDQNKLVISTEYDEGDVVAKDQAVVLYGNSGNYAMNASLTDGTKDANSVLRGYDESHITEGGTVYYRLTTINNDPSTIGFYWGAEDGGAFTVGAHKAYVAVDQQLTFDDQPDARLSVIIGGEASGIENVNHNENYNENGNCYDLQGRRVHQPKKGLYIVNGKKVLVK